MRCSSLLTSLSDEGLAKGWRHQCVCNVTSRVCVTRQVQKLHIRTVPLGEQPTRIAHQEASRSFLIVTNPTSFSGREILPVSSIFRVRV